jgi:hypothetical protein
MNSFYNLGLIIVLIPVQRFLSKVVGIHEVSFLFCFFFFLFYILSRCGIGESLFKKILAHLFNLYLFQRYLYVCMAIENYSSHNRGQWVRTLFFFFFSFSLFAQIYFDNFYELLFYTTVYSFMIVYLNIRKSTILYTPEIELTSWSACLKAVESNLDQPIKNRLGKDASFLYMTGKKGLYSEAVKYGRDRIKSAATGGPKPDMSPEAAEGLAQVVKDVVLTTSGGGVVYYAHQRDYEQKERHHQENLQQERLARKEQRELEDKTFQQNLERIQTDKERIQTDKERIQTDLVKEENNLLQNIENRLKDPNLSPEQRDFYKGVHEEQTKTASDLAKKVQESLEKGKPVNSLDDLQPSADSLKGLSFLLDDEKQKALGSVVARSVKEGSILLSGWFL